MRTLIHGAVVVFAVLACVRPGYGQVITSFEGILDLTRGSDTAGLDGASLKFLTTTEAVWGAEVEDFPATVAMRRAEITISGSAGGINDGTFATITDDGYWVALGDDFLHVWDAKGVSGSVDFLLPDGRLFELRVAADMGTQLPSVGGAVVPGNWGPLASLIFPIAITDTNLEGPFNVYHFTNASLQRSVVPEPPSVALLLAGVLVAAAGRKTLAVLTVRGARNN